MITQELVRELYSYRSDGVLIRKVARSNKVKVGDKVGTLYPNGYLKTGIGSKEYTVHGLIWLYHTGSLPKLDIDHINGIRSDNRIENLREVSRSVNMQNLKKAPAHNKTSGLLGVKRHSKGKRWQAQIQVNKKQIYLGLFDTKEEAQVAYLKAKREIHEGCTI